MCYIVMMRWEAVFPLAVSWVIPILPHSLLLFPDALLPAASESHEVKIYMGLKAQAVVTLCFPESW